MSEQKSVSMKIDSEHGFFYGWVIVAVCFMLQGVSAGSTQYLFGVFVVPFSETFNVSRGDVLLSTSSLMMMASAAVVPFVGVLLRRGALKTFLLSGLACMGIGFFLLAHTQELWQVGVIHVSALAIGYILITVGSSALAANWFVTRRGRALGFSAVGMSAFGFLLPPVVTWLIEIWDWRVACFCLSGLIFLILLLVARFIVDRPEQMGLEPDGIKATQVLNKGSGESVVSWSVKSILQSSRFWVIAFVLSITLGVVGAAMANLVPMSLDKGYSPGEAAWLVSILAVCGVIGKIVFGIVADFVSQRLMACLPVLMVGTGCLLLMGQPAFHTLTIAAVLVGLTMGAVAPAQGTLIGLNFGREAFSVAMGLLGPFIAIAIAIAVPLAGWIADFSGSYNNAWQLFLGLLIVAMMASYLLPAKGRAT